MNLEEVHALGNRFVETIGKYCDEYHSGEKLALAFGLTTDQGEAVIAIASVGGNWDAGPYIVQLCGTLLEEATGEVAEQAKQN